MVTKKSEYIVEVDILETDEKHLHCTVCKEPLRLARDNTKQLIAKCRCQRFAFDRDLNLVSLGY